MGFPVTINGNTYNLSDFDPYGYVTAFPDIINDISVVANAIDAASGGIVISSLTTSGAGAVAIVYDSTAYASGVGGIDYYDFKNSSGTQTHGASVETRATTGTNGAEVADLAFATMRAGVLTDAWLIKGAGTLVPATSDGAALGSTSLMISDLFLASGAVINFNNGDVTATHSANALAFAGATSGYTFDNAVLPATDDAAALGSTSLKWADLFLASGAVINFNSGDVTVTHASNSLAFAGASNGYTFSHAVTPSANDGAALGSATVSWSDLFLAAGAVINVNNGGMTVTHSTSGGQRLTSSGAFAGTGFTTGTQTIGDDSAITLAITGNTTNNGVVVALIPNVGLAATAPAMIFYARTRGAASAPTALSISDATNVTFTTGTLAGTTGTDTKLTISVNNDGNIYIENRLGLARAYTYSVLAYSAA